jgi:hypothetical protein
MALLNDLVGSSEPYPRKKPLIRTLKDTLFGLAFSLAVFVSSSFWGIYYFDKDLIFPEPIERIFPRWLNHAMHTLIAVFIIFELLFTNKNYPPRKVGLAVSTCFFVSYLIWINILYTRTGAWSYPILRVLNFPARIVFFAASIIVGLGLYVLGEKLNSLLRRSSKKEVNGSRKRH